MPYPATLQMAAMGAEDMAQSVKCLLHDQKNLKASRKQIQEDPGDLLASPSSKLVNSSFSEFCLKKVSEQDTTFEF